MANIIELLPDSVANQIAAGEVIQRPASVVKELVENAIDAGAGKIDVLIKDAGRTLIQVIDNGSGMSEMDARMAFERHATSKIRQATDLFAIRTMGFRGEALASIAAVAQVELKTRLTEEETGTLLRISGSVTESCEPCSCNTGSSFAVKNLFFNIPVRRKFLKGNSTEFKYIIQEFQRIALCYPEVEMNLYHHEEEIFLLPAGSRIKRIERLFRKGINQQLIPVESETSIIKISGFITKPEFAKKSPGEQYFFVNQRFMKHAYFQKAVSQAFEKLIPGDAWPGFFIYFEADPESIDINIHPTKTEIKFEDENNIWRILNLVVRESLGKFNLVPSIDFSSPSVDIPPMHPNREVKLPEVRINPNYNPFEPSSKASSSANTFRNAGSASENAGFRWEELYRDFGHSNAKQEPLFEADKPASTSEDITHEDQNQPFILFKQKYILTTVKSGLMIIDKRRAHIRILYERYLNEIIHNQGFTQPLIFPEQVHLSFEERSVLQEIWDPLKVLGFRMIEKESRTIEVNGLPASISHFNAEQLLRELIAGYEHSEQSEPELSPFSKMAEALARSTAVSEQKILRKEETEQLIRDLFLCQTPNFTPGGKKIVSILTQDELDRFF